jgi:uncharacterized surface protein with fasciclin (FAS1) repeats
MVSFIHCLTLSFRRGRAEPYNDILLQTNARRGGDLSVYLNLLLETAMVDNLKSNKGPSNLFVPTNAAFETAVPLLEQLSADEVITLLRNHELEDNLAMRLWGSLPIAATSTRDGSTVFFTSVAGSSMNVTHVNGTMTITNVAKVVQADGLSEYGILQIVDSLLIHPELDR